MPFDRRHRPRLPDDRVGQPLRDPARCSSPRSAPSSPPRSPGRSPRCPRRCSTSTGGSGARGWTSSWPAPPASRTPPARPPPRRQRHAHPRTVMAVPVELGREAAQQAAREELAKQVYRDAGPGPDRARPALDLREGRPTCSTARPGSRPAGTSGLLVAPAAPRGRGRRGPAAGRAARPSAAGRPAAVRRRRAHRRRAPGRGRPARCRRASGPRRCASGCGPSYATSRSAALLEPRSGAPPTRRRAEAGTALPSCAAQPARGARIFDEIWYGGRAATAEHDATLRELDRPVRAARPTRRGDPVTSRP